MYNASGTSPDQSRVLYAAINLLRYNLKVLLKRSTTPYYVLKSSLTESSKKYWEISHCCKASRQSPLNMCLSSLCVWLLHLTFIQFHQYISWCLIRYRPCNLYIGVNQTHDSLAFVEYLIFRHETNICLKRPCSISINRITTCLLHLLLQRVRNLHFGQTL